MGPAAIAVAGVAVSAAAAGASIGLQQAAAADQAAYQEAVARNNEIIAERKAEDARLRGEQEERRQRLETQQLIGRQRAAFAGAGVVVDQDVALDVISDTAAAGEIDALTIRTNAEREALGFEAQAVEFQGEQAFREAEGRNAQTEGAVRIGSTLLTGATRVASRWSEFNSAE